MNLDTEDFRAVIAVISTHAEMQDKAAITSMGLYARLKRDEPQEYEMLAQLTQQIEDFENDAINLRRIAAEFEAGLKEPGVMTA